MSEFISEIDAIIADNINDPIKDVTSMPMEHIEKSVPSRYWDDDKIVVNPPKTDATKSEWFKFTESSRFIQHANLTRGPIGKAVEKDIPILEVTQEKGKMKIIEEIGERDMVPNILTMPRLEEIKSHLLVIDSRSRWNCIFEGFPDAKDALRAMTIIGTYKSGIM